MVAKKMGRPVSDNVKDYMLRVRMDKETLEKLDFLANNSNSSRSEIIRRGITEKYDDTKK